MQKIKPLTRRRRAALEDFMDRPGHPEGTLSYREMQGFLFTVACAPEMVVPSAWLPRIFGENEPPFNTPKEAEAVMGGLNERRTLLRGSPDEVRAQVREAITQTKGERFLAGPGCAISPLTPPSNLRAAVEAVRAPRP